jgi:hypothetical protein
MPVPPPPPPAPPKTLAIAYSDLDGSHSWTSGDVLISKLVDSNRDGVPSPGDTVVLDRYPTNLNASSFAPWGKTSHTVATATYSSAVVVTAPDGGSFRWQRGTPEGAADKYEESGPHTGGTYQSEFADSFSGGWFDSIETDPDSPSAPAGTLFLAEDVPGDSRFIDVELEF